MLLPEMRDVAAVFVAEEGQQQRIIGAAATTRTARRQPLVGPGVAVHVIAPCRRYGVGTGLLQQLELTARRTGASALFGAQRVDDGGDAHHGWIGLGFTVCETVLEHTLPLEQFEPRLAPLLDRMRKQGRIPTLAQIIPLYQANHAAVLQLHLDHLGGDRGDVYSKLRGSGVGVYHPRYSRVLTVGDNVMGCILAHRRDKDTALVDAVIVEPSLRGGWANVWLKLEATRGALRLGIKQFLFTTFDHYTDTRRFVAKMGGTATRTTRLMMRAIA